MINPRELRLGNLVQTEDGSEMEVVQVREDGARCKYTRNDTLSAHVSIVQAVNLFGIPLTQEWLVRFGFTYTKGEDPWIKIWSFNYFKVYTHQTGYCHLYHLGGDIQYVHQLQNLHQSLTGQELTLNDKS
ncbi:hypothetical protein [Pedobacter faecalis]|uniref:hypothetical protein n=1 Tax=Pedobacter faecalis TaxID=3041495 RepID=UPI002550AE9A|nr:hypothetical protein [Pedobacter sp. ELA7]